MGWGGWCRSKCVKSNWPKANAKVHGFEHIDALFSASAQQSANGWKIQGQQKIVSPERRKLMIIPWHLHTLITSVWCTIPPSNGYEATSG